MKDAATGRRTSEQRERERQTVSVCLSVCLYTQWKRIFHGIRTDIIHDGGRRQAAPSFSVAWHLGSRLCVGRLESARGSARSLDRRKNARKAS